MVYFKPKHLKDRGYSLHLMGNGGEEELVIFTSWGQDRKSSLVIVTCTCDDHVRVVYDSKKRVILAHVLTQVKKALTKWAFSGQFNSNPPEPEKITRRIDKVMDKLADKWDLK